MHTLTTPTIPLKKPVGGFCSIPARAILACWWAYKRSLLEYRDVRVWLACFELVARRCTMGKGRTPRYTLKELRPLIGGVGGEHLRASIRRLESFGLLEWSETSVQPLAGDRLDELDNAGDLAAKRDLLVTHRRSVPVPRRLIEFLAGCTRPVVAATLLGHLLRCLYNRNRTCKPDGLCKSSWIADVFEVDARNVKGARALLLDLTILSTRSAPQWVLNRYGLPVTINLEWDPGDHTGSPPPERLSTTQSPPPRETGISLSRSKHQQPGAPAPSGVRKRTGKQPSMTHVEHRDLLDPARLDLLWRDAARRGLAPASEHGRLQVFAAAARAIRLGTSNAPAFFASILRRRLWTHLTCLDEDHARRCFLNAEGMRAFSGDPSGDGGGSRYSQDGATTAKGDL